MKLGLIGSHIDSSVSPDIHNAALAESGIEGSYSLLPTGEKELKARLASCHNEGFQGLNITAPYKSKVLPFVSSHSGLVTTIGSANTLIRAENGWHAESTDGAGVRFALEKWQGRLDVGHALILGSGGFARAATHELLNSGWKVSICSRRILTTDWSGLISLFSAQISFHGWDDRESLAENLSLLLNTTPLGSDGVTSPLPLEKNYPANFFYLDAVYSPPRTPLIEHLSKIGVTTQNGMRILLGQAAQSFWLWTGIDFPESLLQKWEVNA